MNRKKYSLITESNAVSKKEPGDALLQELRGRLKDLVKPNDDDYYMKKWLKARNNDVNKAEAMFRASMVYREKMKCDTLLEDYEQPEVLKKYLTGGFCGYDKDGSPVKVEPFGRLDMKGIMYSARKIDLEKAKLVQCEYTIVDWKKQSEKLNKRVDGLTVLFDMEGVSTKMLWRPGLQMYLYLVQILEDNYPEMMKRMFVINAPRIFPLLWKICRPIISEDMKNKIHVLGADYKEQLLKYIDSDNLPAYLGGSLTDPDGNPKCLTKICHGGEVPQSYYLTELSVTENLESTVVPKGEKIKLEYQVDTAGSVLRWEFKTDEYDIGFGVYRINEDGKKEEVIPPERVNSHMVPEEGNYVCEKPGTYIVCFDNSHSWWHSKTVTTAVDVVPQD